METIQLSLFGKTYTAPSLRIEERTFDVSSKKSQKSNTQTLQFLDLRNGNARVSLWQQITVSRGEDLTRNIGESPREENASFLSQILQRIVPEKYYLTAKACLGILRRSLERGKALPEILRKALERQAKTEK